MSQSKAQIYVHIIFSTKHRVPFLKDKGIRERLHAYLAGVCHNQDSPSLKVGGVEDHVHILCRLSKNIAPKDLLRELKSESSSWVKAQDPTLKEFYWQGGYAIFSISPSHVDGLIETSPIKKIITSTSRFRMKFDGYSKSTEWSSTNDTLGTEDTPSRTLSGCCLLLEFVPRVRRGAATLGCVVWPFQGRCK